MTETLNPLTFDLAAVLAGQNYPTTVVTIYLDESLGFAIKSIRDGIAVAERQGKTEEADSLHTQLEDLIEQVKDVEYKVTLQGIPTHVRKSVLEKTRQKFPDKRNIYGQIEDNLEQDQEYTRNLWVAMIKKIEDPKGALAVIDEDMIDKLVNLAPSTAQKAINAGIDDLTDGTKSGFEFAAQELDFLSTPSAPDNPGE